MKRSCPRRKAEQIYRAPEISDQQVKEQSTSVLREMDRDYKMNSISGGQCLIPGIPRVPPAPDGESRASACRGQSKVR
ncbi:hypothetical protein MDA_GLEAN10018857 [Myotis davidii]|uniref:Uncharacterized protein n=1 Tax=Myotis davidii TaxID=225400 RepID=L5M861_MYODS|nr:hypothetical protein MDA_GLEAN10018857 [Myotis davidii]